MASLSKDSNGRYRIQFAHPERRRQTLRIGAISKKDATTIRLYVERLLHSITVGSPVEQQVSLWITTLSIQFREKLERVGLLEPSEDESVAQETVRGLCEKYIELRINLKPNTRRNDRQTQKYLLDFFGGDTFIQEINTGNARQYEQWLKNKYANATVSREIKRARQFFRYGVDCGFIFSNPFSSIRSGSQTNPKRKVFVKHEDIQRVLEACPDNEWRLLVVLARYGGLRIPSELVGLTWDDIDWDRGVMRISVPKKEHLPVQETREVPIFPEIRPYLLQAAEDASEGSTHVIEQVVAKKKWNPRTRFERIIRRSGVKPWGKLFVNLRASRQTELMEICPAHIVCSWLGNSSAVAEDHYLMVTDEHIKKATQNPTHAGAIMGSNEHQGEKKNALSPVITRDKAYPVPPRGVEPLFSD